MQLRGIRVLELSGGIPSAYLGKLFRDLGAEVLTMREGQGALSAGLREFLDAGKAEAAHGDRERLLDAADIVVVGRDLDLAAVGAVRAGRPHLVVVSITPWGLRGPWADAPASDLVVQAEAGVVAHHGRIDQVPYKTGGRLLDWCAGTVAAVGALAAVTQSRTGGPGRLVEVSEQAVATYTSIAFVDVRDRIEGSAVGQRPARIVDAPSIEPTADGWVGVTTNTLKQVHAFFDMVERPDLRGTPWELLEHRVAHLDEWNAMVRPWLRARTTREVLDAALARRIPAVPVNDGAGVLAHEHFRLRGTHGPSPGGDAIHPRPPYRIDGRRPDPTAVPVADPATWAARPAPDRSVNTRPLAGVRVLDATAFFAGPAAGQVLAFLGAEVIHLESPTQPDGARGIVGALHGTDRAWEKAGMWLSCNRDKLSVSLSLADERGRSAARRLIASCDVVLENYSPRVFESFGFDHRAIAAINPRAVFVRMPAFGLDGPDRDAVGFAQTMEQVSGLAWRTGHEADQPRVPRGPCDPLAGFHVAFVTLACLLDRASSGGGAAVEAAMVESALQASAELVVARSASGADLGRIGNRDELAVPQGVYAAKGHEEWLAIAIEDDLQWQALRRVLNDPPWAASAALDHAPGRRAAHDAIDAHLAAWASERPLAPLVEELRAAGVPAGAVRDPRLMNEHEQLKAFGYYEACEHPIAGVAELPALPMRFDDIPCWSRRPAPMMGQHNEVVLRDLAGLTEAELGELAAAGLISTVPTGR